MTLDTAQRLLAAAAQVDAQSALVVSPPRVTYATGHVVPIETGASPFEGGPTIGIVAASGRTGLVTANVETPTVDVDVHRSYAGLTTRAEPYARNYLAALDEVLDELGVGGAVAVEAARMPALLTRHLEVRGVVMRDAEAAFARAQSVKTPREMGLLLRSARVVDDAQRRGRETARPGMTELQLFAAIRGGVEDAVRIRVAFAGDIASGTQRTAAGGGWPTTRRLQSGDLVMLDLAPRVEGYWADSCNTFVLGTMPQPLREMHRIVEEALTTAAAAARPGATAGEVDHAARSVLLRRGYEYGHHSGHSIGTSVHEWPRIIPGDTTVLEPGMVLLLEPGAYDARNGGIRLERMFHISSDGAQMLTDFPF